MKAETLDKIASRYSPGTDFDRYCIEYGANLIIQKSPNDKTVLEIGCAEGLMTIIFADFYQKVFVIEGSKYYLDTVKTKLKRYTNITYYNELIENFAADLKFDNIVLASILEHLDDPVKILNKVGNLLNSNGIIHIIVPNANSLHRKLGKQLGLISQLDEFSERDKLLGHKRVYNKQLLCEHIGKAALEMLDMDGILLKPLSNAQMENWDSKIMMGLLKIGHEIPDWCNQLYVRASLR